MNTTPTASGRRRRATTLAQQERIMDMATSLPLTESVLREIMAAATGANLDPVETWFGLELEQRCFASMSFQQAHQYFSAVWADGFPRSRHHAVSDVR